MPILSVSSASKHFGELSAFEGVSLALRRGSVLAVAGPNGGGKTTLLRCIAGLYDCDSAGSISYGLPYTGKFELRKQIAYAPDDDNLIEELTGAEYLEFVSRLYGIKTSESLPKANLLLDELQFGGRSARQLIRSYSHGMRKKLQLASVLMVERPLTLIDEPTNGLDPSTVIFAKQMIKSAANQGGIIVSSHNLAFAEAVADQVLLLNTRPIAGGAITQVLKDHTAGSLDEAYEKIMVKANAGLV